jgi:adenylate cyclase
VCQAGSALIDEFANDGDDVLPRGGMAVGNVVLRGGDYYGPVVNLASRLAGEALPGELLVTDELAHSALACEFEPAGCRVVKGFADPIEVHSLMPR